MATMNTTEVAAEFDTTPRNLRKFLRSDAGKNETVGKGARWNIEKKELRSLRTRFAKWEKANAEKVAEKVADAEVEVITEDA